LVYITRRRSLLCCWYCFWYTELNLIQRPRCNSWRGGRRLYFAPIDAHKYNRVQTLRSKYQTHGRGTSRYTLEGKPCLVERATSDTPVFTAVGNNCIVQCQPTDAKLVKWLTHEGICVTDARKKQRWVLLGPLDTKSNFFSARISQIYDVKIMLAALGLRKATWRFLL